MKKRIFIFPTLIVIASLIACNNNNAQMKEDINLEDENQKISYSLGVSIATNLQQQKIEAMDVNALTQAIQDAYGEEGALKIQAEEANTILNAYFQGIQQKKLTANLETGENFLDENKTKEGVVTLASGLQYMIMKEGNGPKPGPASKVTTHYHGTLIDGSVFDSSVERGEPASFPVNGVIKGWTEALQLMPVGSKWKLFIPSELAYGANPRQGGPIEPNMALVFEVELLSIDE
ncbi:MAG TPA: FKBP-type peptidyl-prolyl cis-trans isomerase [Flavobacteriales bacterium]|nr:FKBP-type peptidyl-prolyl cis-trans isomerase [Flavobacteriales bacterium]